MSEEKTGYVEDKGLSEMFFKTRGRLNRWRYFKRRLVLGIALTMLLTLGWRLLGYEYGQVSTSATVYNAIITLIFVVPTYCLNVRRLQDMNRGKFLAVVYAILTAVMAFLDFNVLELYQQNVLSFAVLLMAFFSLAISLYMVIAPGTRGKNSYGPSPISISLKNEIKGR